MAEWLGLISYGVYVLHMPLRLWTKSVLARELNEPESELSIVAALAVMCLAATLADGPDKAIRKSLARSLARSLAELGRPAASFTPRPTRDKS